MAWQREKRDQYEQAYVALKQEIAGLNDAQLHWKEAPEKWSVAEVLSHLADHSLVVSFRIRHVLAGGEAPVPMFAQDSWVSGSYANQGDISDTLEILDALLRYNGKLLDRISDADWTKEGITPKGATVVLSGMIDSFVAHVQRHVQQVGRIKASYAAAPMPK